MRNGYFTIPLTLVIVIGIMIMFQILGGLGVVSMYGISDENWDSQGVLLINSIAQVLAMGGGAWLAVAGARQNVSSVFRLDPYYSQSSVPIYLLLFPLIFIAQLLGGGLASLWSHLLQIAPPVFEVLKKAQDLMDTTMKDLVLVDTPAQLVVALISIAVVPAVCEELCYRGFVLANIERSGNNGRRTGIAIVISSVVFGVAHLSPLNLPAIIVLGLVFGTLIVRTNDIRVTMTAHFINNGIIVLALYFLGKEEELTESLLSAEVLPIPESLLLTGISAVGVFYILSIIGKLALKNAPPSPSEPDSATHE